MGKRYGRNQKRKHLEEIQKCREELSRKSNIIGCQQEVNKELRFNLSRLPRVEKRSHAVALRRENSFARGSSDTIASEDLSVVRVALNPTELVWERTVSGFELAEWIRDPKRLVFKVMDSFSDKIEASVEELLNKVVQQSKE